MLEEDLTMPNLNALPYGSAPYLESSDSGILNAETGEIMQRPVDQSVTLKLKLKKQNENGEYTVLEDVLAQRSYTVAKTQATLQDDVDALTVEDLLGKNAAADQIKTALTLPSLGELAACDITWSADPADGPVDPATGEVTRPQYGDDVPVILTATFQDASGVTATKTFTVTVLVMPTFGENLALGKQVTTSSTYSAAYGGDQAVDGDRTTTRWASKGSNQWIQIDMGTPTKVSALRFYEFAQRISSFVVEYSQDGSSWETASTVTGLPSGATTNRAAYTTEFTPVTAQYFRLRQTAGANDITIFEVELYDTTVRLYESAVSSNDETLGSVSQQGGPGYALGTEVALTAEPAITGKFVQWQLPEGLELTEGTKDTAEIRYLQPKKNLKIVAEFIEKTTASLDVQSAAYDKYESNENHKDIVVHLNPGDYVLQNVLCGTQTLEEGTHYTKEGNTITLLKSWMDTLSGEQTVVFQMDGGEQPALKLTVQDSDPQLLLQADLDAVATPDYQLQSGMTIPAVGPVNGSAITVTSSNTSVVQIVQETQGDQIVHKIVVVTPRSSTNVTLTITASLQEQTKSKSSRHAVAGSGISGGSGGSSGSGGGGGSSVSRPSSPGVIDYGNGTADNTPAQPVPEENQPGSFADVSRDSWASEYVELLVEKGVVAGDELGNYQPDRAVTREEFVKMVVAALGLQSSGTAQLPFTDVAVNDWSYPYIAAAYEAGIISGTSDTTFGVGETMSRQDIAVVTARALDAAQVEALPVTESIQFTDAADAADYAAQSIDQIARFGIVGGYPDGSFRPLDTITRAEAAKVLAQIIRLKEE